MKKIITSLILAILLTSPALAVTQYELIGELQERGKYEWRKEDNKRDWEQSRKLPPLTNEITTLMRQVWQNYPDKDDKIPQNFYDSIMSQLPYDVNFDKSTTTQAGFASTGLLAGIGALIAAIVAVVLGWLGYRRKK